MALGRGCSVGQKMQDEDFTFGSGELWWAYYTIITIIIFDIL